MADWEPAVVVAGVHSAASALPPRATSLSTPRFVPLETPQRIPAVFLPRTNGTRQESLGCCGLPPIPATINCAQRKAAMISNALLIAFAILLALGFWLMGELKFLVPYKAVLFQAYMTPILIYTAALAINLFAASFILIRKFFLKDTGRKLLHLDKQLHLGETSIPAPWLDEEAN
jgi:hypothetical protein